MWVIFSFEGFRISFFLVISYIRNEDFREEEEEEMSRKRSRLKVRGSPKEEEEMSRSSH